MLKRKKSTGCDVEVVGCKVADAKRDTNSLVDGLRQDTFDSYDSICRNINQLLVTIRKPLKKMFDREAKKSQQNVHDVFLVVAGGVKKSFVDALEIADRSLSFIVGPSKRGE